MDYPSLSTEQHSSQKRRAMLDHFAQKSQDLNFSSEPLLPEWWQVILSGQYGMLFEPFLSTTIADEMVLSDNQGLALVGNLLLMHTAVLHPKLVLPEKVLELPLIKPDWLSKPSEFRNYTTYSVARFLLIMSADGSIPQAQIIYERSIIRPYIHPFYEEVCEALSNRDYDRLHAQMETILSDAPSRYFHYWWDIFFDSLLY